MKKIFYLFLLMSPLWVMAQTITGVVRFADNTDAAIGVSVYIKGTDNGTITDLDGKYSLEVKSKADVLVFSYIGYTTVEEIVGDRTTIDVTLAENSSQLDEVVVVGYTTQKRSEISGSVASIKSKDLAERPILRVEQALQGKVAGVQVAQSSGSPGSPLTVRIRGIGTINNSDPLYIVDGVAVDGLDFLNPNDIENIDILKDAASSAIYGSRGANGVVLITTKKGSKEKQGTISYDFYYGVQRVARLIDLLNAREYATLQNEAYIAAGKTPLPEFNNPSALGEGTDWQEAIFETAPIMSHQITATGGGPKSTYTLSANYFTQDGIVGGPKANFQRATVRLNNTHETKSWLTLGSNLAFTWLKRNGLTENSQYNSPIIRALNMDPVTPVYKADGTFAYSTYADTDIANPVNGIYQTHNTWTSNRIVGNAYADIKLGKGLSFRSSASMDATFAIQRTFNPRFDLSNVASVSEAPAAEKNLINSVGVGNNQWRNWQWENFFTWQTAFADRHKLTLIGGTSALANRFDGSGGGNTNLPSNDVKDAFISNTIDPIASQTAYQYAYESSLLSYFGKAYYGLDDKYLFSATLRADGSSRFGRNNRFGYFPSFSAGWKVTAEDFWQWPTISNLKVRASWGQNGNDRIGDYSFTTIVEKGQNYAFGPGEIITNGSVALTSPNPDLKWETSTQTDVGVDVELLEGRVNATVDYYRKKTSDMLYAAPIPLVAGTNAPIQNVATALNSGWEFSLTYRNSDHALQYSVGGNLSLVDSKVTGLGLGGQPVYSGYVQSANANAAITDVGYPIASFYGFVTEGIFQTQQEVESHARQNEGTAPGDIKFKDLDGNGLIDQNDRTIIGNPTPDFTYGFNAEMKYKNFELSLFAQGSQGNDIYNSTTRYDFTYVNRPSSVLERWTGPGTSNSQPRVNLNDPNQNARVSDRFVEDGSYLRLKTLQLSYYLPVTMLTKVRLSQVKVYVSAQNLITFTNYSGYDPEIGNINGSLEIGIDRGFYPSARTFMTGCSISF
ncbi:MAG: TonB-dependent receptor [Saprospiraceae bacterium]|nr:TonB-dependent receptor [Saprospiraceae bacterium]